LWWSIFRDFSLAEPEPGWQKMGQSPLNYTTQLVDSEDGGGSTMDRRWLKKMED